MILYDYSYLRNKFKNYWSIKMSKYKIREKKKTKIVNTFDGKANCIIFPSKNKSDSKFWKKKNQKIARPTALKKN